MSFADSHTEQNRPKSWVAWSGDDDLLPFTPRLPRVRTPRFLGSTPVRVARASSAALAFRFAHPACVDNLQHIARLMAPDRRHPDKDIRKAIAYAQQAGWTAEHAKGKSHRWGTLSCGSGCEVAIWSTPRRPGDIAKRIREAVKKCDHNPDTPNTTKRQTSP